MKTDGKKFESIKSKVLKLHALAERGEEGEAKNARRLLESLLECHGLTLDDILSEQQVKKRRKFNVSREWQKKLLHQCYFQVLNVNKVKFAKGQGFIVYELTDYEYAELSSLYEWHKEQLGKELKQLQNDYTEAYAVRHNITADCDDDEEEDRKPLTPAERAHVLRILQLSETVEDSTYRKMIENK